MRISVVEVVRLNNGVDVRKRIIDETQEQFLKFGYSKVTMDGVADNIGISKKTIYKHFASKNELIRAVLFAAIQETGAKVNAILHNDQIEYLVKLRELMSVIGNFASKINSACALDFQKNAPEIWPEFESIREKMIMTGFRVFIREGIAQGVIRNDVNLDLVLLMFVNCVQSIINPKVLSQLPYSMKEVFDSMVRIFFNGILVKGYKI